METLPRNVLRRIGNQLSLENRRRFENAINPLPEGLASFTPKSIITRLLPRPRTVPHVILMPKNWPRSIDRSRSSGRHNLQNIDRLAPHIYKNPHWKYLKWSGGRTVYLSNNGRQWYILDKNTGQRRNVQLPVSEGWYSPTRRTSYHTPGAYTKRLSRAVRTAQGSPIRNRLLDEINKNVERYLQGNKTALNQRTFKNLLFYAQFQFGRGGFHKEPGKGWMYKGEPIKTRNNLLKKVYV